MSEKDHLDQMRSQALDRIERSERNFKLAMAVAAVFEALFLATFVLLMEFHNRTHALLLISTVGGYSMVIASLIVLGAHVNLNTQRILRAIELIEARPAGEVKQPDH